MRPVNYQAGAQRPVIVRTQRPDPEAGIQCCCCCRVCSCINLSYLKTTSGILKVIELIICCFCQSLLIKYGMAYSSTMGSSFTEFLTTVASCLLFVSILLFCYVVSSNSLHLIRSSILEVVFNLVACFLYISSASHLSFAVNWYLWANYLIIPGYSVYPAMTACYMMGFVLGILHGTDAWLAYKQIKGR